MQQIALVARTFTAARQHYCDGRVDEAERLFLDAVAIHPHHYQSLCALGVIAHRRGDLAGARDLFVRALAINANLAEAHNNLGVVLQAEGQIEAAVGHFRQALRVQETYLDARNNLAMALLTLGRFVEAVAEWRRALALAPGGSGTDICIIKALYGFHLADREGARRLGHVIRAAYPERPILQHGTAGILGEAAPAHTNLEYVRALFDFFADNFELALDRLLYSPKPLIDVLAAAMPLRERGHDILDAGCGTGLCAGFLRPWARTLVGCDLSLAMIAQAGARRIYDELEVSELTAFLGRRRGTFDMVVAADVVIYFGDLAPLLSAARMALREGGVFAFSLETPELPDPAGAGFVICPSGHYKHTPAYVEAAVARAGFVLRRAEVNSLRLEEGHEAKGLMVVAEIAPPSAIIGQR